MKTLYKLREWLDTYEAANYLSAALHETVSRSDVLRLALDGHLRISVNLVNHASANLSKPIPVSDTELFITPKVGSFDAIIKYDWLTDFTAPPPKGPRKAQNDWLEQNKTHWDKLHVKPYGDFISDDMVVRFDDETVFSLDGIWDLCMKGAERIDIEHAYYADSYIEFNLISLENVLLSNQDGTQYARLLERYSDDTKKYPLNDPNGYYPAGGLPNDSQLVIRLSALNEFLASLAQGGEKKLDQRERTTLLAIIGVLANAQGLDLNKPHKSGDAIAAMLELKGVRISGRTIGEHLKAVQAALGSRTAT